MSSLTCTVAPTVEPVTPAEAKLFARIDTSDDDTLITYLIAAAREWVEVFLGRSLTTATYGYMLDAAEIGSNDYDAVDAAFESGYPVSLVTNAVGSIYIPRPPLISVTNIKYWNTAGTETTWDATNYSVDTYSTPGRIYLPDGSTWPASLRGKNAMLVTYTAGYGAAASAIPYSIRLAVMQIVATRYEHRENMIIGSVTAEIPDSATKLLTPYRIMHRW